MSDTGYIHCGCRDCFETTIGEPGDFCDECEEAGCELDHECQRADAYGGELERDSEREGEPDDHDR